MPTNNQLIAQATKYLADFLKIAANGDYDSAGAAAIDCVRALEEVLGGSDRADQELAVILAQGVAVVLSERLQGAQ